MAGAIIRVKDDDDGTLSMDIEFNPEIDNNSLAHRLVQRFVEFINAPSIEGESSPGREDETVSGG
jgi:hypothetical protein